MNESNGNKKDFSADLEERISHNPYLSKEDPEQSAVLWVAEDGRTVGYGTLIDPEDPNKIYRLR